jgi:hypothetical protein
VTAGFLKIEGLLGTGYWCSTNGAKGDICDGFIIRRPDDTKSGAVAKVSLDATEPDLFPGALVFCLPAAQITHPSASFYPIEGFILLATGEEHYRRVGLFSECRAFHWINEFDLKQITIV